MLEVEALPWHAGQPLPDLTVHRALPRYTVQPPAPLARRVHLLHLLDTTAQQFSIMPSTPQATRPFSYVAGDAASYAWRRSDKTAPGHAERGTPGAGMGIPERDLLHL